MAAKKGEVDGWSRDHHGVLYRLFQTVKCVIASPTPDQIDVIYQREVIIHPDFCKPGQTVLIHGLRYTHGEVCYSVNHPVCNISDMPGCCGVEVLCDLDNDVKEDTFKALLDALGLHNKTTIFHCVVRSRNGGGHTRLFRLFQKYRDLGHMIDIGPTFTNKGSGNKLATIQIFGEQPRGFSIRR